MKAKLFLFLLGGLLGFLVAALFQPLLGPMLTGAFRGEGDVTEGRVVGKRLQGERLLLTVDAAEGTILATFKQRVPEIDMLVQEGDLLKLGVPRYEPFVEDPPILAVRKQELPAAQERPAERPASGIIPRSGEPRGDVAPQGPEAEPDEGQAASPEPEAPPAPPPPPSASSTAASRP
jgi:hypothetical protein